MATWLQHCRTDEAAFTMKLTFDSGWHATVTDDPLPITPHFTGNSVVITRYTNAEERDRFLANTFGSQ